MQTREESFARALGFLAGLPFFAELNAPVLATLAQQSVFRLVEKGETLFFQSDSAEAAYVVYNGVISIVLSSSDGRELVINEMQAGDLFGELGILTRKSRSTNAVARTKSEVLVIPGRVFRKILEDEPRIAMRLLEITADRLQMSGKRESALAFMDAQARLARLLLELEAQEQKKGYITISQEELANRTGLIRQTVAKALGRWRRAGWLITGRGHILILNRKALEDLESRLML
jgi:CRP/FNR family transcriptional regulator, cyclic AMP receptor protein